MRTPIFVPLLLLLPLAGACGNGGTTENTPPQQFGTVRGAVTAEGAGVAGATLELTRTGVAPRSATTNNAGEYEITQVATGTWTLTVTPPDGFDIVGAATASVTVSANQAATVDFQAAASGPAPDVIVIAMRDNSFNPADRQVTVGATVRWVNEGAVEHNSTGANGAWTSPNLAPNQTFEREFSTVGEFQYSCTLHPGMDGIIRVVQ